MPDTSKDVSPTLHIRPSRDDDVEAMLAIYRSHIFSGVEPAGRLDAVVLNADDLKRRRKNMRNHRLPHLVAEAEGVVVGYAYAVPFRKRPAYRYTLKHSIYVHNDWLRAGVGRVLLPALVDACAAAGYRQLLAYVDASNAASIRLHTLCGFHEAGRLQSVAWKFDGWADMVLMQRPLVPEARQREAPP